MGSRVRTAVRKRWCPAVLYGLPLGLRFCSALVTQLGQRPCPWCSSGQAGLVHTRHALPAISAWSEYGSPSGEQCYAEEGYGDQRNGHYDSEHGA
jgi:hypothetical protein